MKAKWRLNGLFSELQDEQKEATPDSSEQAAELRSETRLTRKRVADQLGVSIFKVRSMEGKELHPEVVGGVHYFDPEEVAALEWSLGTKRRGVRGQ